MTKTIVATTALLLCLVAPEGQAQNLSLDDIFKKGTYSQQSVYGLRSMNDGLHYTTLSRTDEGPAIEKFSYESGEKTATILTEKQLRQMTGNEKAALNNYRFSDDEQHLLISFDSERIYRHSTKEHYYIVNLSAGSARVLANGEKQRHATFSPDSKYIAYVQENNIYVQNYATGGTTMITKDGAYNQIINGFADWVYEEEFAFDRAFFWSPDGKKIAYYKFDESAVKEFHMPLFNGLYPEDYRFKYPKAGEDNAVVSIHIYDMDAASTADLDLGDYEYIPRIKWTQSSELLAVMKMPRLQNVLEIELVNTTNMATKTIYREASETYIEISDDLTFLDDNAGFVMRSEKDGYFHLYRYDLNGQNEQQLTSGMWEVKSFLGYSAKNELLYFSAGISSPINTAIYHVPLNGGDVQPVSNELSHTSAAFSSTFDYFIAYTSTANSPLEVSLHKGDGTLLRTLEENTELREKMEAAEVSEVEFFTFTSSENVSLNGWMVKPRDFNRKKKYPVLMFVYGGPGSQTVSNSFGGNYWWHQYLAGQGYIVLSIDNRGTGARGRDFRTQTYGRLGELETKDQVEGARWLAQQSYVDAARIGIWGWSYGGYMSSLCLFKGAGVFKTAVAVAPVSNWRFYDSIYTERYMGLPQDNAAGYDENSPINHVEKMEGNYLLVHGTADDNVHFQNAVEMADALIAADKHFDFYIYPDRNHGIYGGNTRYHLYTKMTNFITENL